MFPPPKFISGVILICMKWLQSSQQADLFDNLFVRMNPSYLTGLSPIVALSVGVAVTSSLETSIIERLAWLDVVLYTVDLRVSCPPREYTRV